MPGYGGAQAAQAQHESFIIHVVSYRVILKMAVNIKDLYDNSGKTQLTLFTLGTDH